MSILKITLIPFSYGLVKVMGTSYIVITLTSYMDILYTKLASEYLINVEYGIMNYSTIYITLKHFIGRWLEGRRRGTGGNCEKKYRSTCT